MPTVSGGHVVSATVDRLPEGDIWRVVLDVGAQSGAVVEMQLHLAGFGQQLTETWAYQWVNA